MADEGKRNGRDENEHGKEMQADHHLHEDRRGRGYQGKKPS